MKVELHEAKLKSFELALQSSESDTIARVLERSEKIYQYIFGTTENDEGKKMTPVSEI